MSPPSLSVPLAVTLFERRAVFAFVGVAIAVAAVVVVIALTIPLRADRVEAFTVSCVAASGVEAVAVAVRRSRRSVAAASRNDDTRILIDRRGIDAPAGAVAAIGARDSIEAFTVADLESLPLGAAI